MSILDQISLFEAEDIKERKLKLYIDQDGVLTNFEQAFTDLGDEFTKGLESAEFEDKYGTDALWKVINKQGKLEFWENMSWTNDGHKLWNYVKKFNPTILTTPAHSKFSKNGKEIWIKRELGPKVPFIFAKDKFEYADTESILIDDYGKKIKDWIEKGDGIGIKHESAEKTIEELKKYGL